VARRLVVCRVRLEGFHPAMAAVGAAVTAYVRTILYSVYFFCCNAGGCRYRHSSRWLSLGLGSALSSRAGVNARCNGRRSSPRPRHARRAPVTTTRGDWPTKLTAPM